LRYRLIKITGNNIINPSNTKPTLMKLRGSMATDTTGVAGNKNMVFNYVSLSNCSIA